ncbi:hypothetical protein FOMPIDRAFT_1055736 [Fomitopsis schrenkii]|uniref:Uncharacterized protein n=1 Tax=Fomitopsis schrenkii TaxID=2126942 RepID=S8EVS4_FOMSC|nr:hypothetical protein FOMPIDRAFT_1055736 [Fomitopsis schrenkii]
MSYSPICASRDSYQYVPYARLLVNCSSVGHGVYATRAPELVGLAQGSNLYERITQLPPATMYNKARMESKCWLPCLLYNSHSLYGLLINDFTPPSTHQYRSRKAVTMHASTICPLVLAITSIAPALALPYGNARTQAIPVSPVPLPTPSAPGPASGLPAPHLPAVASPIPGMHHKHLGVHKAEHSYHGGLHVHGKHGHHNYGDHRRPGENRPQRGLHTVGAHHHWHGGEHNAAGAHSAHRQHPGVHHPQFSPVGQQPEQNKPSAQIGMVPKLRAGAHYPQAAGITVGLAAKPHAHHHEGVQLAKAGEPRAFDEPEDDLFARSFDEELFARALADELVTRKATFGEVMGDLAHFLKREDERLLARVDEDEEGYVTRDTLFDELD